MIYLPQDRNWKSTQGTDLFGSVVDTRNMNFDERGYAQISPRMVNIMDESVDTDLGRVMGVRINPSGASAKILTDDEPFDLSLLGTSTQDVSADRANNVEDSEYFNDALYTIEDTGTAANVSYLNTSDVWTDLSLSLPTTLSGKTPLSCENFRNLGKLALGVMNRVRLLQTANTLDATNDLTIPAEFVITSLAYNNNNLYITTWNRFGGGAFMFIWNGSGTSAQYGFPVPVGVQIFSIKAYKSSVVLLTSGGQLLRFTGNGFEELGNLPVYYDKSDWNDFLNYQKSSNRSMFVDGDLIYINIDGGVGGGRVKFLDKMKSGIWCYDPNVGLYHRYGIGSSRRYPDTIATASVNTTTNIITVSATAYGLIETGTPVQYYNGGSTTLAGLTNGTVYYTIKGSTNEVKLALTKALATAGTAVDLTGTGNNNQKLLFYPENIIADLSSSENWFTGVLASISEDTYPFFSRIVAGSTSALKTNLATDYSNLSIETIGLPNVGELTFAKVPTSQIEDNFVSVLVKFENLYNDDKIILKYRQQEYENMPILLNGTSTNQTFLPNGTWSDGDTLTSTSPTLADALAGDEVTFYEGSGAGHIRHISSISESAGTYTVNFDETVPGVAASDVCRFKVDRWVKHDSITSSDSQSKLFRIVKTSKFIQFKLEIRGIETKIEDLIINNVTHKPVI